MYRAHALLRLQLAGGVLDDPSLDTTVLTKQVDKNDEDSFELLQATIALNRARREFDAVVAKLNARYDVS